MEEQEGQDDVFVDTETETEVLVVVVVLTLVVAFTLLEVEAVVAALLKIFI